MDLSEKEMKKLLPKKSYQKRTIKRSRREVDKLKEF
jgi:hypothetical protein